MWKIEGSFIMTLEKIADNLIKIIEKIRLDTALKSFLKEMIREIQSPWENEFEVGSKTWKALENEEAFNIFSSQEMFKVMLPLSFINANLFWFFSSKFSGHKSQRKSSNKLSYQTFALITTWRHRWMNQCQAWEFITEILINKTLSPLLECFSCLSTFIPSAFFIQFKSWKKNNTFFLQVCLLFRFLLERKTEKKRKT